MLAVTLFSNAETWQQRSLTQFEDVEKEKREKTKTNKKRKEEKSRLL